jgi:hypothetical protein
MKDSMKMSVGYQFSYILMIQLAASAVAYLFGIVAFAYFLILNVARQIVAVAFMTMNFVMLYIYSKKFALLDNKPYTKLKPSLFKGVLFGVQISVINVLLLLALTVTWNVWANAEGALYVVRAVITFLITFLTFPYSGILNIQDGSFSIIGAVLTVIVPVAATVAGYIAGSKKFEISEKFDSFIYEKDDE